MQEKFNVRLETRIKNGDLVRARENLGYYGVEIARQVGISRGYYYDIESMKVYPPKEIQEKICRFFRDRGIMILEEDIFPEYLRELNPTRKYIMEKSVEPAQLLSLSHVPQRLLPHSKGQIEPRIMKEEAEERLNRILSTLDPRATYIVKSIFGIPDGDTKTPEELAVELGLNPIQVRQIEYRALRKLRHPSITKKLKPIYRDLSYLNAKYDE